MYRSLHEAVRDADAQKKTLAQLALETESRDQGRPVAEIRGALKRALDVMRGAIAQGLTGLADARGLGDEQLVDALATAGLIGAVVAERASLSGAEGGCQAETGAAAAMAAGAATEMLGGSPTQVVHAVALAQQGTLGLVCDPLGGLVELPCVFRNATGAAIALAAIEMAVAGVNFVSPAGEVIDTMGEIGREMDVRYRETAGGGLAATPTGRRLARERLVQIKRT